MSQITEGFRLSPQQKRLWTLQQTYTSFWSRSAIRIAGPLQIEALKQALASLAAQHEILRTTYHRLPNRKVVLQAVGDAADFDWELVDLRSLSFEEQARRIEASIADQEQKPVDLAQTSALSATLLVLPQDHILVLRVPALSADAWTMQLLARDLSQAYAGHQQDDEEIVQYLQFSEWQHELLETDDEERQAGTAYWQKFMSNQLPRLILPFEQQPSTPSFQPQTQQVIVERALADRLRACATEQATSLHALMLAAWEVLLWRTSGQPAFTLDVLSDGRVHDELKDSYGLFAKYLPVRCSLQPSLSFTSLARQQKQAIQAATQWQDYFVETSEAQHLPTVGFEFAQHPLSFASGTISFTITSQRARFEPFKIKLSCVDGEHGLLLTLEHNAAVFEPADLRFLLERFQTLLQSIAETPQAPIESLAIIGGEERRWLLREFNSTARQHPASAGVHLAFEQQVERTPHAPALAYEEQQLTYAELNTRANQLAHRLRDLGVGPDVLVGIRLTRSPELIVALLAVLKAGGAYVPLEPSLPAQRLHDMLEDIQARVLLTEQSLRDSVDMAETVVIALDADWPAIAQEPRNNPAVNITADNLAYVLFTSGSTGRPKGVCVEHRQLLNYLFGITARLDLPPGSSYGFISTFAADLGNTVIFPSLCTGGCLHILSQARAGNAEALADYCRDRPIDCLKIVPSHIKALLASSRSAQILPRRYLILGGEGAAWELVEQVRSLAPECVILNHYGPTETTVGVLTHRVGPDHPRPRSLSLPLSRPIDNTHIYILDAALKLLPIGVPGELHIGGAALARGYLNQPQLTSAQFIPDPFAADPDARLYKSGDLARFWPDGTLEILGRIDDQVKFHGYRVELDEIRQVLNRHPEIQDSVVILHTDQQRKETLVAYYIAKQELGPAQLRSYLAQSLIEETIPTLFIKTPRIPLTPNGKVDRQALLSVEEARQKNRANFVAPQTPVQATLAAIWSQILGVSQVGIHDSFFALGGDSILGIQIIARANQAGIQISPKQLFQYQTIAELATVANSAPAIQAEQGIVSGEIPLTPIQHWLFDQDLSRPEQWTITVILNVLQPLDATLLRQALQQLLAQHDALRLRFVQSQLGWRAFLDDQVEDVALMVVDRATGTAQNQEAAIDRVLQEIHAGLSLERGRLFQAAYIDYGPQQPSHLILVAHRLVIDGVSWRMLLDQFGRIYTQLSQGGAAQLPTKTTSVKYWAERLREYAQSEALRQEYDYWRSRLTAAAADLPTDATPGDQPLLLDAAVRRTLDDQATTALLQDVPSAYQTEINDALLTALAQTLTGWSGAHGVLIDLEGHGREPIFEDVDLSGTAGWFTSLYPVALTVSQDGMPGDQLKAVKEQLREIPQHGLGYGLLRYLNADAEMSRALRALPAARCHFRYVGQIRQPAESSLVPVDQREPIIPTRQYLLAVNAATVHGQLEVSWWYSSQIYRSATVERLADTYMDALQRLIADCSAPEAGGYTPSDFPLMDMDQQALDALLGRLDQ